jgi:predicted nucleotidyltransferase component of viral defense system
LLIDTQFDSIRQILQVDIGFGDVITPDAVDILFPALFNELENPKILAYSVETVIAEKFEAMITLGTANSRMKDFFDVFTLLKKTELNTETLSDAIKATFRSRNIITEAHPPVFEDSFYRDTRRISMWNSFLRKNKLEHIDFETAVTTIAETLQPIYRTL